MHKGLLCYHSTFFKSALNGNFKEASTGIIDLPEDDFQVFERFNIWLYTRRLYDKEDRRNTRPGSHLLIKLYLFADCRGIEGLRNAVIDLLDWKDGPSPEDLKLIYDSTPEGCKLRMYAIDTLTWACNSKFKKGKPASCGPGVFVSTKPRQFVTDFMQRLLFDDHGNARFPKPAADDRCKYHDHTSTPLCSKQR